MEPRLIEEDLVECPYVEKLTDGKVPRVRLGAFLCRECCKRKCEFKPKETFLIVKSSSDLAKNVAFRNRVRKLHNEGWSIERIRKKLNVTRETVRTILKSFEK